MSDKPKSGCGCGFWGCMFFLAVFVIMIGAIGFGLYVGYSQMMTVFSTSPMTVPTVQADETEFKDITQRIGEFRRGEVRELSLTADELNQVVEGFPGSKGKAHFEIKDNILYVTCSLPMDLFVKGTWADFLLSGKYLNGKAGLKFVKDGDLVTPEFVSLESDSGVKFDAGALKSLNGQNLGARMAAVPEIAPYINALDEIKIEDDTITFKLKPAAAAPDAEAK
ncbi:hypothetical protein DB346_22220 [Verrucomicrobia bacterium LW23]|nr:hypothetical protein DB346_22220 [Verrucomicrobia bacterium LW23]